MVWPIIGGKSYVGENGKSMNGGEEGGDLIRAFAAQVREFVIPSEARDLGLLAVGGKQIPRAARNDKERGWWQASQKT
jgi:hypothetical protein